LNYNQIKQLKHRGITNFVDNLRGLMAYTHLDNKPKCTIYYL